MKVIQSSNAISYWRQSDFECRWLSMLARGNAFMCQCKAFRVQNAGHSACSRSHMYLWATVRSFGAQISTAGITQFARVSTCAHRSNTGHSVRSFEPMCSSAKCRSLSIGVQMQIIQCAHVNICFRRSNASRFELESRIFSTRTWAYYLIGQMQASQSSIASHPLRSHEHMCSFGDCTPFRAQAQVNFEVNQSSNMGHCGCLCERTHSWVTYRSFTARMQGI